MNTTSAAYLKSLKMLHKALLTGVIMFSFIVILIVNKTTSLPKWDATIHQTTMYIAPIVALLGILLSTMLYKKKLDAILGKTPQTLLEKLTEYRTACILRWATIEAAMLFCTIFLFFTGKYYYVIFLFLLLVFFIMYAPSKEQIAIHLNLSSAEQELLEDEYAMIG